MITVNQLFENYETTAEEVVVYGCNVVVSKRLTHDEYSTFVNTIVDYMARAYRDDDFLPFRMLLRLFTIYFYTNLDFDDDTCPDNVLKLVYESDLYEKIVGANGEPSMINMAQYNDMLADISYTLKQRWQAQTDEGWFA